MNRIASLLVAAAFVPLLASCAASPTAPALRSDATVDLPAFMGTWHVIANIPYFPERGKVATRDVYTLRPDGRIDNVFVFRKRFDGEERRWTGLSRIVEGTGNAHWQVRFIWPFEADLLILEVDPEGRWALLGHPQRKYAWIFGREPVMDDAQYALLRERFRGYGYDPARILRVPQVPEQVGRPGFQ